MRISRMPRTPWPSRGGPGAEHLDAVAAELNDRPRTTLDYDTPAQRVTTLLTTNQQQCCNDR
ncbi:hypothetical protein [Actinocrispum sp. NPDC049592]|uniref:hypothetical protein n=1 Tax=Actinocrispum sp. NPDC049592 TaxID=3154835 RepID=UPI0034390AC1